MLTATIFDNVGCATATPYAGPWPELVKMLARPKPNHVKNSGKLLKLARMGDKRKPNPKQPNPALWSLKHDENVQEITGIEGDYDAGKVSIEHAVELLEAAGIRATVYSSWGDGLVQPPKYNGGPRWRVLAPLSAPCPPQERELLLARLNGALGGILASESWTLSQGYFFDKRPGANFKCISTFDDPTDGTCIDELPELDAIAIGKRKSEPAANDSGKQPANVPIGAEMFEAAVEREGRLLVSGDGRRELLKSYIASRSARGLPAGDIRLLVDGIAARYFDPDDPMDEGNIDELVDYFVRKDHVQPCGFSPLPTGDEAIDPETGEIVDSNPLLKPVSVADVLTNPSPPPAFVWDGYLPCGVVTLWGAHGGVGKSTCALMLAVAVAAGRPLFGVATTTAPVVFASLEDGASIVRHRLAAICRAWGIDPLSLADRLHIVDGTENPELFAADSRSAGDVTPAYLELSRLVQSTQAGLVVVDNASDSFGGDEINRRQVRGFMRALGQVARLTDCAVCLLAHVDKTTSRNKKAEGGEGYSGSTAWHNSARSRLFMTRGDDGLLTLEHQKSNLGKRSEPLTLVWLDGGLPMLATEAPSFDGMNERTQGRASEPNDSSLA